MNKYTTSVSHLSKELGVSVAEANGFIKVMEACGMATKVGHVPVPADVKKKGKRSAVFEIQSNVEVFVSNVPFNPIEDKNVKNDVKASTECAPTECASTECACAEDAVASGVCADVEDEDLA